jgi:hypothetical protein
VSKVTKFALYWSGFALFCIIVMVFDVYTGIWWGVLILAPVLAWDVWRLIYTLTTYRRSQREIAEDQAFLETMQGIVQYKRQNP